MPVSRRLPVARCELSAVTDAPNFKTVLPRRVYCLPRPLSAGRPLATAPVTLAVRLRQGFSEDTLPSDTVSGTSRAEAWRGLACRPMSTGVRRGPAQAPLASAYCSGRGCAQSGTSSSHSRHTTVSFQTMWLCQRALTAIPPPESVDRSEECETTLDSHREHRVNTKIAAQPAPALNARLLCSRTNVRARQ